MKNGFTLVELLAVIVILAVLALIATPVVLSIIDDTKESAMLRSAEMYLSGVENAVMRENMNSGGNFRPNDCTISNGTLSCNGTTVEVEVNGEVPKEGTIVFENGKIKEVTLNYETGTIIKDASGNLVYEGSSSIEKTLNTICTYLDNGVEEKTVGAKYSCEVKPGTSYNFYVLKTPAEGDATINLIMEYNINASGEAVIPGVTEDTGAVAWLSKNDGNAESFWQDSSGGPVTAMKYLYNATKSWTNVEPLNYEYYDRQVQGIDPNNPVDEYGYRSGYESFISINGIATITKGDEDKTQVTIGTATYPLRARMPIYSNNARVTEVSDKTDENAFLYINFDREWIKGAPIGYWLLSSYQTIARIIGHDGGVFTDRVEYFDITAGGSFGVRPVITLKI